MDDASAIRPVALGHIKQPAQLVDSLLSLSMLSVEIDLLCSQPRGDKWDGSWVVGGVVVVLMVVMVVGG